MKWNIKFIKILDIPSNNSWKKQTASSAPFNDLVFLVFLGEIVNVKKEWRKTIFHKENVHWKYILLLFMSVLTINIFPAPALLIKERRPCPPWTLKM